MVQDPRFMAVEARLTRSGFAELVEERFIHLPIMLWSAPSSAQCLMNAKALAAWMCMTPLHFVAVTAAAIS